MIDVLVVGKGSVGEKDWEIRDEEIWGNTRQSGYCKGFAVSDTRTASDLSSTAVSYSRCHCGNKACTCSDQLYTVPSRLLPETSSSMPRFETQLEPSEPHFVTEARAMQKYRGIDIL